MFEIKNGASFLFRMACRKNRGGFGKHCNEHLSEDYLRYKKYFNYEHLLRKHFFNAEQMICQAPCSLFSQDYSVAEVYDIVRTTIEQYNVVTHSGNRAIFERKFPYVIGTDINKEPVYCYKVVCSFYGFALPERIKYQDFFPCCNSLSC